MDYEDEKDAYGILETEQNKDWSNYKDLIKKIMTTQNSTAQSNIIGTNPIAKQVNVVEEVKKIMIGEETEEVEVVATLDQEAKNGATIAKKTTTTILEEVFAANYEEATPYSQVQ